MCTQVYYYNHLLVWNTVLLMSLHTFFTSFHLHTSQQPYYFMFSHNTPSFPLPRSPSLHPAGTHASMFISIFLILYHNIASLPYDHFVLNLWVVSLFLITKTHSLLFYCFSSRWQCISIFLYFCFLYWCVQRTFYFFFSYHSFIFFSSA